MGLGNKSLCIRDNKMKKFNIRWMLVVYDFLILALTDILLLGLYRGNEKLSLSGIMLHFAVTGVCVFLARFVGDVYHQVWRYGGIQCYIRLLCVDFAAFLMNLGVKFLLPILYPGVEMITFARLLSIACINLLGALTIRMFYRYAYKCGNSDTAKGKFLNMLLRVFAGENFIENHPDHAQKIKIAIVGAGRVGVALAEELHANKSSAYSPRCFIDVDLEKVGKVIHGIPVFPENEDSVDHLRELGIQEVVFCVSDKGNTNRKALFDKYLHAGYKIKVYDFPVMHTAGKKRYLRDFDIEELLFRQPICISEDKTYAYYKDKVVLITGGGGSIGSELCRQLSKMFPKKIIILDIYENGAYDVQQELKIAYGNQLEIGIEICSITNYKAMDRVFAAHRPDIVINAAAHKHVPLMEHNCIEAVENNVFGTRILIELCEKYNTNRFMMVSTDKAVNPTNVMGATKRMCEMLVQSASTGGTVKYSTTRFGNVLGSAGSVIPLFKRQIMNGGPITLTDKRIIRYFMTIPEASQLVLQSGAMAKNGELFVLDMGQPVKIYDLAQNMIRLSGARDIEIVETGLRPGEKLYEELLIKTEKLDKTENSLIFIERDTPIGKHEIHKRLAMLEEACESGDDDNVRHVLHQVVPTFR